MDDRDTENGTVMWLKLHADSNKLNIQTRSNRKPTKTLTKLTTVINLALHCLDRKYLSF